MIGVCEVCGCFPVEVAKVFGPDGVSPQKVCKSPECRIFCTVCHDAVVVNPGDACEFCAHEQEAA